VLETNLSLVQVGGGRDVVPESGKLEDLVVDERREDQHTEAGLGSCRAEGETKGEEERGMVHKSRSDKDDTTQHGTASVHCSTRKMRTHTARPWKLETDQLHPRPYGPGLAVDRGDDVEDEDVDHPDARRTHGLEDRAVNGCQLRRHLERERERKKERKEREAQRQINPTGREERRRSHGPTIPP